MGLTVAELSADLGLNASGFDRGMQSVLGKFGGISPVALAAGAAGAAGIALITKKALDLGASFDDAYDTIRIGTGATGEALDGLKDDFKAVLTSVPTDMETASTAVADLNTRLGLTGEELQEMSAQMIDFSRLTGTDLPTNIQQATRVFGDWNIAGEEQAETMDKIFRAGQAAGIGYDQLMSSLVQFGAPLRNVGFSFEESAALISGFEKAGVNTGTVMSGLRAGIGKLAKEGEAVPETFRRVVDEITKLGPGSEATALAIELFGQRAGPDLADAITGGKFAIDDMLAAITEGEDTIAQAAADTDDWRQSWTLLKNKALVFIEPAVSAIFKALGWLMDVLVRITENKDVQAFFAELGAVIAEVAETVRAVVASVRANWDTIGPIVEAAWKVVASIIGAWLAIIKETIGLVMAIIRGDWDDAWEHVKNIVRAAWRGLTGAVRGALDVLKGILTGLGGKLLGWIGDLGRLLLDAGKALIQGLIDGITGKLGDLKDTLGGVARRIIDWKGPPSKDAVLLRPAGRLLMDGLMSGIDDRLGALRSTLGAVTAVAGSVPAPALAGAFGAAGGASGEIHEHYHLHFPGGSGVVGMAEDVGRTVAPAVGRQSAEAEARRARVR